MGRIIQRVRIVDQSDKENIFGYGSWPRVLEVQTFSSIFKTPTKIVTSQELNSKANLGLELDIPGNISILDRGSLDYDHLKKLMTEKETVGKFITEARKHRRRMHHFQLRLLYLYPSTQGHKKKKKDGTYEHIRSGVQYLNEDEKRILTYIDLLKEISEATGLETVAIPSISQKFDVQKVMYKHAFSALELGNPKEIIPVIDMNQNPTLVEKIIDFIIQEYFDTGLINAIGFKNSFADSSASTRASISSRLSDKEILVPIFSIDKKTRSGVSGINRQSIFFGDAFSPGFVHPIKKEEDYKPTFLDTRSLQILESINGGADLFTIQILRELQTILGRDYEYVHSMIQQFIENASAESNIRDISAISRIHFAIFSQREVVRLRNALQNKNYYNYKIERAQLFATNQL